MKITDKTVFSEVAPPNVNVNWMDTSTNPPTLKVYIKGKWVKSGADMSNYYTKTEIDNSLDSKMNLVDTEHPLTEGEILTKGSNGQAIVSGKKLSNLVTNPTISGTNGQVLSLNEQGETVWTTVTATGTADTAMSDSSTNAVQNKVIKGYVDNNFAMKNGFYEDLTAGNAVNILSEDVVTEQTTLDITAPNNEIGNGTARMQTIEGDGVAWSQLYDKMAGGASVATEAAQLEFLFGKVVERFSNAAGTTPMPSLFLREFLTGADLTGRVAVTGEGFVPAVTEENQSNYTGLHYKVRATHAEAVQRSGEEGSYSYSSAFFVGGANFSASAKRNVIDMALAFGIDSSGAGTSSNPFVFSLPTSAPSTLAAMYGWLGSKVGLSDDYDYNGGELIGVRVLQLRSMPGVNLLDPTSGVALCPYYEWENADGLYRVVARNGAAISGVAATALGGQPVAVVEVTAGSVYEVSVPEGDAVVMQVTLSSGSLADCACWQVWDDSTPSDEVGGYSRSLLSLEVGRVYGKLNGEGEYVKVWSDGEMKGAGTAHDVIYVANDAANVICGKVNLGDLSWYVHSSVAGLFITTAGSNPHVMPNGNTKKTSNIGCAKYAKAPYDYVHLIYTGAIVAASNGEALRFRDRSKSGSDLNNGHAAFLENVYLWCETETALKKSYSDLMYDTRPDLTVGEPVLVPLSTAFNPTYQVGNTGVTMQAQNWDDQTKKFASSPVSCAATTSAVMPGNATELLRSLTQMNILEGWVSPDEMGTTVNNLCTALVSSGIASAATATKSGSDNSYSFSITKAE